MTSSEAALDAPPRVQPRRLLPLILGAIALLGYVGSRVWAAHQPFEWSGTVEARTISVGSKTGGRVKEVLVKEGDHASPGQPLLVLEPGDIPAQELVAEGQLREAKAQLEKLERGSRPEEIAQAKARAQSAAAALQESVAGSRREEIAAGEARLAAAEVSVSKAKLDADRIHRLLEKGAASQADADNSDTALQSAIAQRDAQKQGLEELRNGSRIEEVRQAEARAAEARANAKLVESGSRVEDIEAAQGRVEAAQGRLDQIAVMLDELTVKSPRSARVESLDLRPGDILAPNATAAILFEEDQLYVRIYVPETQVGHLKVGQEVPIAVDSFPGRTFQGKVEHISDVGEYSPRNLQTADERADQVFASRIGILPGQEGLRAGMAAFITVPRNN